MFVGSCKRLRIMKGSEAIGLGMLPLLIFLFTNHFMTHGIVTELCDCHTINFKKIDA